eukprot:TRINITY_DN64948_c0_g1_i1.p1 TRINITY_DN64948_c0_g1~~TRINITY_DN64948_c0_g1_i1.p1  ORF type:complete len:559 (+),score=189.59 TRINITY_DN64948_c0_g1_i1:70-1677(+)
MAAAARRQPQAGALCSAPLLGGADTDEARCRFAAWRRKRRESARTADSAAAADTPPPADSGSSRRLRGRPASLAVPSAARRSEALRSIWELPRTEAVTQWLARHAARIEAEVLQALVDEHRFRRAIEGDYWGPVGAMRAACLAGPLAPAPAAETPAEPDPAPAPALLAGAAAEELDAAEDGARAALEDAEDEAAAGLLERFALSWPSARRAETPEQPSTPQQSTPTTSRTPSSASLLLPSPVRAARRRERAVHEEHAARRSAATAEKRERLRLLEAAEAARAVVAARIHRRAETQLVLSEREGRGRAAAAERDARGAAQFAQRAAAAAVAAFLSAALRLAEDLSRAEVPGRDKVAKEERIARLVLRERAPHLAPAPAAATPQLRLAPEVAEELGDDERLGRMLCAKQEHGRRCQLHSAVQAVGQAAREQHGRRGVAAAAEAARRELLAQMEAERVDRAVARCKALAAAEQSERLRRAAALTALCGAEEAGRRRLLRAERRALPLLQPRPSGGTAPRPPPEPPERRRPLPPRLAST